MPNLLAKESSLYLRQHAHQSVNWMPWGCDAFEKADQEDKPILVSIGYSSCHWCKVMSEESFEDDYISSIMNRHFICIKVDREERPDVDQTYMDAVRLFNQTAGWPLHAFCLPDGNPFWGGTYFPKEDLGQEIVPWPLVLMRISEHYRRAKPELVENGQNMTANLKHANDVDTSGEKPWSNSLLLQASEEICKKHDAEHGGFTQAPKFPSPMKIDFLLAMAESQSVRSNQELSDKVNFCITRTLDSMAQGGLFDHVGGGFFRYSVDREWKIPHFEKMLCDNALLLSTYSKAYRKYQKPAYRIVVEKTLRWLLHEMGEPSLGFCSTLSADYEGKEGGYYLWEEKTLQDVLGDDSKEFIALNQLHSESGETCYLPKQNQSEKNQKRTESWFEKLLQAREKRLVHPEKDEKRVTAWNALALRALADSSIALGRKDLLEKAFLLAEWMKSNLLDEDGGVLSVRYGDQTSVNPGFLDDHAFWAEGLLALAATSEWVEEGSSRRFLDDAESLARKILENFKDEQNPGYYFPPEGLERPAPSKKKFWFDNAVPAGNSSMIRVFSALAVQTGKELWNTEYRKALTSYSSLARKAPYGIGHALTAIAEHETGLCSIEADPTEIDSLMDGLANKPYRPIFAISQEGLGSKLALKAGKATPQTFESCDSLLSALFDE